MNRLICCPLCGWFARTDSKENAFCSNIKCSLHNTPVPVSEWNNRPREELKDRIIDILGDENSKSEKAAKEWHQSFDKLIASEIEWKVPYEAREAALLKEIDSLKEAAISGIEQWPLSAIYYIRKLKASLEAMTAAECDDCDVIRDLNFKYQYEFERLRNENSRLRVLTHEADEVPDEANIWIPCDDRLPDREERYLTKFQRDVPEILIFRKKQSREDGDIVDANSFVCVDHETRRQEYTSPVSHWMALPELFGFYPFNKTRD